MSRRIIEEAFHAITPRGRRGIPAPPTITTGFSGPARAGTGAGSAGTGGPSGSSDLNSSLSQAAEQIARLQAAYQQQASLISANTQALQSNTSSQTGHSVSAGAQVASNLFGGGLGFLSPVISGIASLFGVGPAAPAPLSIYTPPAAVQVLGSLSPPGASPTMPEASLTAVSTQVPAAQTPTAAQASQPAAAPQITVNISAMDSQSIMDRSTDIANAVREAMLNMHPINNVIANL